MPWHRAASRAWRIATPRSHQNGSIWPEHALVLALAFLATLADAFFLALALAFGVFEGLVAASPVALIGLVGTLSRKIRFAGEVRFLGGGGADEKNAGDKER